MNDILPSFEETKEQRTFRQKYMKAINMAYKYDESIGIMDIGEDKKISLQDIYVPLQFQQRDYGDDYVGMSPTKSIVDLFEKNNKVVLSGKPGSGKTTLSRSLINSLSSSDLTVMSQKFGRRLPIYIKLRDYKIDKIDSPQLFLNEFIKIVSSTLKMEIRLENIEFYLNSGWCFLIFDGVDEVGSKENRLKVRDYILKHFNEYSKENYILITSRPTGIENSNFFDYTKDEKEEIKELEDINKIDRKPSIEEILLKSIDSIKEISEDENSENITKLSFPSLYYVAPFSDDQIKTYSTNWFKLREENPQTIVDKVDDFIESIKKIKNLSILRRRPVFLSMMIHIHTTKGKLPYSRAMAYRYMVEAYIEHIDIARRLNKHYTKDWSFEDKERVLEGIAYKLHSSIVNSDNGLDTTIQITLSKQELKNTIKEIIKENEERWQTVEEGDAEGLLEFYISRTGLLHEPEENKIQFSHLSFQEYLTAHYIYKKVIEKPFNIQKTIQAEILDRLDDSKWDEVVLLFFSLYKDATDNILEQFYDKNKNNIDFMDLTVKLLDTIEYGLKESSIDKWFTRIIEFLPTLDGKKEDTSHSSEAFDLILKLNHTNRIKQASIESEGYKKLSTLLQEKEYKKCENILYLLSNNTSLSYISKELILENNSNFLNEELIVPMELFASNMTKLYPSIYEKYTLKSLIMYHDTISDICKENFIRGYTKDWKFYFLRLYWKIINLYMIIEFKRLNKKTLANYTIKRFMKFQQSQYKILHNTWEKDWYVNIWREHKDGIKKNLDNDKLFHHYDYYLKNNQENQNIVFHSSNQELENEIKSIKLYFSKYPQKGETVLWSIITAIFTSEQVEKKYNIDLSIPWKDFKDFKDFSKILLDNNLLYSYLEDLTDIPIDKKKFNLEVDEYMNQDYSIEKLIHIILRNEESYEIIDYQEIKKRITS